MTIFGQNHVLHPGEKNETMEISVIGSTYPILNYVFFVSFTLNFIITGAVNPAAFWVHFKSAKDSIPNFITCFLMVSDMVTNVYFPILWNYKLLREGSKDERVYLPSSPFEVFNTCLLDIVSLLSVFYVAALSNLLLKKVLYPLNPVSEVKAKRFIIGGTVFIAGLVIAIYSVMIVLENYMDVSIVFYKYAQKVLIVFSKTDRENLDSIISYHLFILWRTLFIAIIIACYHRIALYLLMRRSGMNETRRQSLRGGKVAAAMSLGSFTFYILTLIEGYKLKHDEYFRHYGLFLISCFAPSMLATYNSFMQVALVKEVQDFLKSKCSSTNVLH